jgi:hypothetical protein
MPGGRASFEIQVQRSEHWTTEEVRDSEAAARAVAKALADKKQYKGVRIVKYWERSDGIVTETVIFKTEAAEREERVTISPIESAPYCKKTREYYRRESRDTVGRLFRKYLEKVLLTPTELMHSYKALRKVQEAEGLFPSAVDRVATLQAQAAKVDSRERRDEVYKAVAQMTRRVQQVEQSVKLPSLKDGDLDRLIGQVERLAPPEDIDFYALVALSRDLMQRDSWLGKLERLVELTRPQLAEHTMALLDGVYADLFGIPTALQDVLGPQNSLADALCAMADLWEGHLVTARNDLSAQLETINRLIAEGKLNDTKQSVMERVWRQLASGQPLNRSDPAREREAFRDVANRLFRNGAFLGGPATAAALTRRYVYLQEAGGKTGLTQSVDGVVMTMPDSLFRMAYLQQLSVSELGPELAEQIEKTLERLVKVRSLDEIAPAGWPPIDRMLRATRLYDSIGECAVGSVETRKGLQRHVDRLLVGYIESKGLIARLDDPSAPLFKRAIRLLEFSAARVLPHGSESHRLARDRIVELLRQPNFEVHFIEGIPDRKQAEDMLRHLHSLMAKTGFRVTPLPGTR